jgi:hypothetical protein
MSAGTVPVARIRGPRAFGSVVERRGRRTEAARRPRNAQFVAPAIEAAHSSERFCISSGETSSMWVAIVQV